MTMITAPTKASDALVGTAAPGNTETVIIGSVTYTFETTLTTDGTNTVEIGTLAVSMSNLAAAINAGTGSGTVYGSGTVAHPDVTAVAGTNSVTVTSRVAGTVGNYINVAGTYPAGANAAWSGTTLADGTAGTGNVWSVIDALQANAQINADVIEILAKAEAAY